MSCDCPNPYGSGNDVYNIPVKIGAPLSTACQRVTVMGSIPVVIRFPNFTLVDGGVPASKHSMGGIANMSSFFKNRTGCYYSKEGRLASTCA